MFLNSEDMFAVKKHTGKGSFGVFSLFAFYHNFQSILSPCDAKYCTNNILLYRIELFKTTRGPRRYELSKLKVGKV